MQFDGETENLLPTQHASTLPSSEWYYYSYSSSEDITLPEPSAYYNCNEESSLSLLYNSLNTGQLYFTPNYLSDYTIGKCQNCRRLYDSGGEWFSAPHNTVFNPGMSNTLYISLWFYIDTSSGTDSVIVNKLNEYQLLLTAENTLRFRISLYGSSWDVTVTADSTTLYSGQCAYNGSNEIYLGHNPSSSFSSEHPPSSSSSFMPMAMRSLSALNGVNGWIDEMAFFVGDLSSEQCALLYNGGTGIFYRSGYWGGWVGIRLS